MSVDNIGFSKIAGSIDLGPTQSLQLMFAKLQLVMAEQSKTQAMAYMDEITASQEKSKEVAEMIQRCRELQSQAKEKQGPEVYVNKETGETMSVKDYDQKYQELHFRSTTPYAMIFTPGSNLSWSEITARRKQAKEELEQLQNSYVKSEADKTVLPADVRKFMEENGLAVSSGGDGLVFNADQWDFTITSLRNYQEQIGANTQQQMVFIQDFMGQYNSYLQGANSAIQQSNQTLAAIARGQ